MFSSIPFGFRLASLQQRQTSNCTISTPFVLCKAPAHHVTDRLKSESEGGGCCKRAETGPLRCRNGLGMGSQAEIRSPPPENCRATPLGLRGYSLWNDHTRAGVFQTFCAFSIKFMFCLFSLRFHSFPCFFHMVFHIVSIFLLYLTI